MYQSVELYTMLSTKYIDLIMLTHMFPMLSIFEIKFEFNISASQFLEYFMSISQSTCFESKDS